MRVQRVIALLLTMLVGVGIGAISTDTRVGATDTHVSIPSREGTASPDWTIPMIPELEPAWTREWQTRVQTRYALLSEWVESMGYVAFEAKYVAPNQEACGLFEGIGINAGYCIPEETIYLTQEIMQEFAEYSDEIGIDFVIGHEAMHGILEAMLATNAGQSLSQDEDWLTEYRADCGAGVYVHWLKAHGHVTVDEFDIDMFENLFIGGLDDASAHGDFGHGLNLHRMKWFHAGFTSGDIESCLLASGHGLPVIARN